MTSVTPPQDETPQPVQWAVNIYAAETQRAAKLTSDIAKLDKTIAQLTADREKAVAWQGKHTENAKSAWRMAERECAENGWTMPPVPDEAPLVETTAFPAQKANGSGPIQNVPPRPASFAEPVVPPATPAQPSPPPATAPEPASEHESDPVRRVDLSATQGGGDRG